MSEELAAARARSPASSAPPWR